MSLDVNEELLLQISDTTTGRAGVVLDWTSFFFLDFDV